MPPYRNAARRRIGLNAPPRPDPRSSPGVGQPQGIWPGDQPYRPTPAPGRNNPFNTPGRPNPAGTPVPSTGTPFGQPSRPGLPRSFDPRSSMGTLSRGNNIYNGGTPNAHSGGGPQFGAPSQAKPWGRGAPGGQPTAPAPSPQPSTPTVDNWPRTGPWGGHRGPHGPQPGDRRPGVPVRPIPGVIESGWPSPEVENPDIDIIRYPDYYDPEYERFLLELQNARAGLDEQEQTGQRRLGLDQEAALQDLQRMIEQSFTRNEQGMATQGLLRSGINIAEQGEIAEQGQQSEQDLNDSFTRQIEDLLREINAARTDLENAENQAAIQHAQAEQQFREDYARQLAEQQAAEAAARAIEDLNNSQPQPSPTGVFQPPPALPQTTGGWPTPPALPSGIPSRGIPQRQPAPSGQQFPSPFGPAAGRRVQTLRSRIGRRAP